jgi:hypothetical protein
VPRVHAAAALVLPGSVAQDDRVHVEGQRPGLAADPTLGRGWPIQPQPGLEAVDLLEVPGVDRRIKQRVEPRGVGVKVGFRRAADRCPEQHQARDTVRSQQRGVQVVPTYLIAADPDVGITRRACIIMHAGSFGRGPLPAADSRRALIGSGAVEDTGWCQTVHQSFADADQPGPSDEVVTAVVADLPANYFDIYRLAVEMADRISARRGIANSFFLTINTAVLALLGSTDVRWYPAAAGIAVCVTWWAILKSYRDLNRVKFEIILALEGRLPTQLFGDEWTRLRRDRVSFALRLPILLNWLGQYKELGQIERIVPWVFVLLYLTVIIVQAA